MDASTLRCYHPVIAFSLVRSPPLSPLCACVPACLRSLSLSLVLARSRMTDCIARPRWRWCVVSVNVRHVDDVEWTRRVRVPVVGIRPGLESKEDGCDDRAGVQRIRRFVSADRHWHEGEEHPLCLSLTDRARRSAHSFHVRPMIGMMFTLTFLSLEILCYPVFCYDYNPSFRSTISNVLYYCFYGRLCVMKSIRFQDFSTVGNFLACSRLAEDFFWFQKE